MAKTPVPENRNPRKEKNSGAIGSTNQAKSKRRSRTMNGHIKDEEPMNGHVKHEEPEDIVVPSSSAETDNGDSVGSGEEAEEGGGGKNGKIASEEDGEELVEKINGYIRKGRKREVKNQGKAKRKKEEMEAEEKIEDTLYKFPMNCVSRIIRSEISNVRLSQEAVFVINRASEKFLDLFSREAYACAFLDRKSYIAYDHLSSVVSKRNRFDFVSGMVLSLPFLQTLMSWQHLMFYFNWSPIHLDSFAYLEFKWLLDFVPERVKAEDALAQISESGEVNLLESQ